MEPLKHECGVAMIRLLKPLDYYEKKYGTWLYAINKLYLMMEKQHNRGQEGAGVACVKLQSEPGTDYMFRERALGAGAITEIFAKVQENFKNLSKEQLHDTEFALKNLPFVGEIYMGHLRYSTTGKSGLSYVHPFLRRNNWRAKNLCLCGNFNMTNVDDIFNEITAEGQHPRVYSDTFVILEQLGHRLDCESERLFDEARSIGLGGRDVTSYIEEHINVRKVLSEASRIWDGGYVICGITGSGEMFTMRDPWGIRPAFYYQDDEIVAVASERPVIQTAFDLDASQIHELQPGDALTINKAGKVSVANIITPKVKKACSFERIYFSRGSDIDIYRERKSLGESLTNQILKSIDYDVENTVFSFIPNTAEVAFYGMLEGFKKYLNNSVIDRLMSLDHKPSREELEKICNHYIRSEKVAIKDIKLRTFIAEGNSRNDLAAHVYDITYGSLRPGIDNLVIIDDSIVRGTTLRESVIRILDRLHPKKIVIVSSAPQIRYPDYYGIDMSKMSEFIAFKAAIELLKQNGKQQLISEVYVKCKSQMNLPKTQMQNFVKEIYAPFTDEEISAKMVEMLKAPEVKSDIQIVYQLIDNLHKSIPNNLGDWYFSGDYPTPGGIKRVSQAFIDWYEEVYNSSQK
ncbi:MAG: amidophosphoribosyltransferase [Bacteroidales bacterium]|nr:amidophosphoribosyltransferase [Bacteroidales bacterium]